MKTQKKDLTTVAYEKGVQDYLKEIAESGSDVHENYTPTEICDMMLDKVDLNKAETVLVLYNIELLFALKKRKFLGHVTFFTQSREKAGLAPKIFGGVAVEYIDKEENPLYFMENKWTEKFDVVIANPPYGSGTKKLDIKFLDKAIQICGGEIVFVHPSSQYVDGKGQNPLYKSINEKIGNNLKSVTLFNGNGLFGIGLYVPCAITHISMSNNQDNFDLIDLIRGERKNLKKENIDDISIFGYSPLFNNVKRRIKSICDSNGSLKEIATVLGFSGDQSSKMFLKNPNSFFVETTHIGGSSKKGESVKNSDPLHENNFFVLLKKNNLNFKRGVQPLFRIWFEFETETEAKNFIAYCKTNFFRACISFTKTNQNIAQNELSFIPAMDFTQEWTNEKLYAHFNITEEEQAFIKEVIPPYYD
jgi:hypothetical protein